MPGCSTSVNTEVQDLNHQSAASVYANSSEEVDHCPLQHEKAEKENKQEVGDGNRNVDEEEDEDEDVDFNPSLIENHSVEATSSLSSEVEDLDTDVADSGGQPSVAFVKNAKDINLTIDGHTIGDVEHDEEIMIQTSVSSRGCGNFFETTHASITARQLASNPPSENVSLGDKENGSTGLTDVGNVADSRKAVMDMDTEGAISMRTRARYSLASFTLDELETFLQETDDEDDLQNVDDEKEYRKFLAAVLQGDDSSNLPGNVNADDEDEENDADFDLELEEALESDPDEIEERGRARRNRRQKPSLERSKKTSGQLNRPLRPLLPFVSMGSFSSFDEKQLTPSIAPSYMLPVNNGFTSGFTPHQIGQLHCLIHEHIQLLIQVFSVCVLDHSKSDVSADVKKLILEMLQQRDQVLGWRTLPYPRFCFFPPYIHPSVPDELNIILPLHGSNRNVQRDLPSESNGELPPDVISPSNGIRPDEHTGSFQTSQCASWMPYISGSVLSVTDVAPLRLVGNYIDDVSSAVQAYRRYQVELGFETHFEKEPLFPLRNSPCSAEPDGQGERETCPQDSCGMPSSSSSKSKKTMAATLIEKAKKQSVALVPKEIAKLAQRFWPLFNPALYPRKPPPPALARRVLFTDTEDELLALGLMEYNTDWKAIQQRFLPCKSRHQIFVRQKNRASSKAPENPIKAVRRMKNSPLTSEEIARIDVGLKKFKLDWISIWRFLIPHRDPSLLPRQWRIACGTQKAYKSDANKKAKRRLCDSRRKASRPSAPTWHSSSEKEGCSTDNAADETNRGDRADKEDEAYVHEAFLADWRPDSNVSLNCSTHLSSQIGSQASQQKNDSGSANFQPLLCPRNPASLKSSTSQVILRPYRARKSNYARLVKLAPNLPPVNLPPSVRVMSQSAFKSSQAEASTNISGNASKLGGMVAKTGAPQVGSTTNSDVDHPVKSGQITSNSVKISASDQHKKQTEVLTNKCVAEERNNSDLQMHPLLFQAPQLPYYPMNCSTSNFTFFSEKQPQLNLGLFHNPRHIRDAVNFLSKTSKPPKKISSSSDVEFHPLLHDDVATVIPSNAESNQRDVSQCGNSSASGTKVTGTSEKVNELNLDIYLSFKSKNQEAVESRNMTLNSPISGVIESESEKDLVPDEIGQNLDSSDLSLVTSRKKGGRKVADIIPDESLPGIIMEQEELSDSEEEFGENVEFDHEEMADSEGEGYGTSDSDELLNIPNEEVHIDEMDEDIDDMRVVNPQDDCKGITCSTSAGHSVGLELADNEINMKPHVLSLNLNSHPPVSPHSNVVAKNDFGPFGQNQLHSCSKILDTSHTQNHDKDASEHLGLGSDDTLLRKPRKRACRSNSNTSILGSGKVNLSSNVDKNIDNLKKVSEDELD
ncbi:hypothetical protein ACJIZ3_020996 [Penstemon smallii]|uniref:Homeodomain-like superfamily protein n=1 Tax=Penstemon smallii TaxID=265156 RepID=A0ABD3SKE4_9LAMI